jgi:hypothetical protein
MPKIASRSQADPSRDLSQPSRKGRAQAPLYLGPKRFDPVAHGGVKRLGFWFLFFGFLLPTAAMIFECTTHYCAQHFFDPFPSTGHVLLFALIPLSNLLSWWGTRRDLSNHLAAMSLLGGMAMGVGILYALMFLPITPTACLATAFFGFGLLALSPVLSLPCNLLSAKTVGRLASGKTTYFNAHQVDHIGHMIILVMVIAVELPSTLTRINLSNAAEADPVVSQNAVRWLRKYGSAEVLQRACYEHSGRATDILGSVYESEHPFNVDAARRVFFRVTGKPFNSVPIPAAARATIQRANMIADTNSLNYGVSDEFDLDTDIAGEKVSGMARGLSLAQSTLSGALDGDAALGSLEWTLGFTNVSKVDREARAKILLPPQAVVTRASLIVRDKVYDATIMVRDAARAQYQSSVNARKEPLLVSMAGADQLLVQCYPISAGETVKICLEIAAPLTIRDDEKASLTLPAFTERNFIADKPTDVDIKSTASGRAPLPLTASGLINLSPDRLSGTVTAEQLTRFQSAVVVDRIRSATGTYSKVWCKADPCVVHAEVERRLVPPHYYGLKHLLILIDGSYETKPYLAEIVDGLKALPSSIEASVKIIGDQPVSLFGGSSDYLAAINDLKKTEMVGGQDDFATLRDGLQSAAGADDTAVLWLHAAQPLSSGDTGALSALLRGASTRPYLFDLALQAAPNQLLTDVYSPNGLIRLPRSSSVAADLTGFFSACRDGGGAATNLAGDDQEYDCHPTVTVAPNAAGASAPSAPGAAKEIAAAKSERLQVDDRLLKIWANREIALNMNKIGGNWTPVNNLMANQMQIVSPVSSAIVVQTDTSVMAKMESDKKALKVGEIDAALKQVNTIVNEKAKSLADFNGPSRSAELYNTEPGPAQKESKTAPTAGMDAFSSLGGSAPDAVADLDNAGANGTGNPLAAPSAVRMPNLQGATNGTLPVVPEYAQQEQRRDSSPIVEGVNTAGTVRPVDPWQLLPGLLQLLFLLGVLGAIAIWCKRASARKKDNE